MDICTTIVILIYICAFFWHIFFRRTSILRTSKLKLWWILLLGSPNPDQLHYPGLPLQLNLSAKQLEQQLQHHCKVQLKQRFLKRLSLLLHPLHLLALLSIWAVFGQECELTMLTLTLVGDYLYFHKFQFSYCHYILFVSVCVCLCCRCTRGRISAA